MRRANWEKLFLIHTDWKTGRTVVASMTENTSRVYTPSISSLSRITDMINDNENYQSAVTLMETRVYVHLSKEF